MSVQDPTDKSEMRLTGLILTQSLLIGAAVGIYDAGIWLPGGESAGHYVNGITYAMGALAVQILAYYLFKMFFEEQMQDKVRVSEMQRQRDYRFREQQFNYDQRRADMELRMQEMSLEKELLWMQQNPGQTPPNQGGHIGAQGGHIQGLGIDTHTSQVPFVEARPLNMGLDSLADHIPFGVESAPIAPRIPPNSNQMLKKDGTPDLRYKGN